MITNHNLDIDISKIISDNSAVITKKATAVSNITQPCCKHNVVIF